MYKHFGFIVFCTLLIVTGCTKNVGVMGEYKDADLFFNDGSRSDKIKGKTSASILVESAEIQASKNSDVCYIKLFIKYRNTGKVKCEWSYSNMVLSDSDDRVFEGAKEYEWVDVYQSIKRPLYFIECEPGLETSNYVVFKIPKVAFQDDVHVGIRSSYDKNIVQSKIKIFSKSESTFNFESSKSFSSVAWI